MSSGATGDDDVGTGRSEGDGDARTEPRGGTRDEGGASDEWRCGEGVHELISRPHCHRVQRLVWIEGIYQIDEASPMAGDTARTCCRTPPCASPAVPRVAP